MPVRTTTVATVRSHPTSVLVRGCGSSIVVVVLFGLPDRCDRSRGTAKAGPGTWITPSIQLALRLQAVAGVCGPLVCRAVDLHRSAPEIVDRDGVVVGGRDLLEPWPHAFGDTVNRGRRR